jgi:hypothetical protein
MNGIESSIYFMLAMMFVGMPATVIGGIAWECRRRSRAAGDVLIEAPLDLDPSADTAPVKPR